MTASSFDVAKGSMSLLYVSTSTNTDITNLKCVFVVQPASKAVTLTVPFTVDAIDFTASTPVIMSKGTGSQNISCTYGKITVIGMIINYVALYHGSYYTNILLKVLYNLRKTKI